MRGGAKVEEDEEWEEAWDDAKQTKLKPGKVREARRVEMEYIRKRNLYYKVPRSKCYEQTGKPAVKSMWLDTNKGDEENENYRSRFVGKEFNFALCDTRQAAATGRKAYSEHLISIGFKQGEADPCLFVHAKRGIKALVHRDDYVAVGEPEGLRWMKTEVGKRFEIKTKVFGPDKAKGERVGILHRNSHLMCTFAVHSWLLNFIIPCSRRPA
jgi:hypothetical protein